MDDEPCPKCGDSGFDEIVRGGYWTGEVVWTEQRICDCPCGDDVRREHTIRRHLQEQGNVR
jgi:hypothetical protein